MTLLKYNALRITTAITICLLLVGCVSENAQPDGNDSGPSNPALPNDETTPPIDETNVAKVKVLADGTILLDDKQVTIGELTVALTALKEKNGVVWYYREDAEGEPPPEAMSVMQAVVGANLPIKLSTKPDFTVFLGPNGN